MAFVTGSCAYGTPGPDSDIDVLVSAYHKVGRDEAKILFRKLREQAGLTKPEK